MSELRKCPSCGTELPSEAPSGLCMACLASGQPLGGEPTTERGLENVIAPSFEIPEQPGDRIGRYKLLQQIGEGGCGVVYMAEQSEPLKRRVALKVIKLGMDTKQVIARFEAE